MMGRITRMLITAGAVVLLLGACGGPAATPEEELRAWVEAGVEAVENERRGTLLEMISPAYADGRGYERDDIDNLLRGWFFRQDRISLLPRIEEITVYDATAAKLMLTVGMAGTNGGVLGFSADAYRFAFELEKKSDQWQLISARWGELGDELR